MPHTKDSEKICSDFVRGLIEKKGFKERTSIVWHSAMRENTEMYVAEFDFDDGFGFHRKADFAINSLRKSRLRYLVECKTQLVSGTTQDKILANIDAFGMSPDNDRGIIAIVGDGISKRWMNRLRRECQRTNGKCVLLYGHKEIRGFFDASF